MFSSFQLHDGPMNFFDIYNLRTSANLDHIQRLRYGVEQRRGR